MLQAQITSSVINELKTALNEALPGINSCPRMEAMARGFGKFSYKQLQEALIKAPVECEIDDTAFDAYLKSKGFKNFTEKSLSKAILAHAYVAIIENGVFSGYSSPVQVSPLSIEPGHYDSTKLLQKINDELRLNREPFFGTKNDPFARISKDFKRKCVPNISGVEFLRRMRIKFGRNAIFSEQKRS